MRIINISPVLLLVLCSLKNSFEMAIIKGLNSPETIQDYSSGKSSQAPEATNVRTKKPETDSLNDAAKPQLPEDLKEPTSLSPITPKTKRCARAETVGSRDRGAPLSLARRDITEWRLKQCESCRSRRLCKERNVCRQCNAYCEGASTSTTESVIDDNIVTDRREEAQKREVTEDYADQAVVVGSRLKEYESSNRPRYYSLGSVEPGTLLRLFSKIFNFPDNFDKLIVLGKMKNSKEEEDVDDIVIIDLAQVFRNDKKIVATIQELDQNLSKMNKDLIENLDKNLDDAIMKKLEKTGSPQLNNDEIHEIVDDAMQQTSNTVGNVQEKAPSSVESETATRCNVDDAVEDLLNVMPTTNHKKEKPDINYSPQPQSHYQPVHQDDSSEEVIVNPPVIQDNYKNQGEYVDDNEEARASIVTERTDLVGANLEDGYIDDNEEARASIITERTDLVGADLEDGYIDDNEEARPNIVTEFKSKPALQEVKTFTVPKETENQIIGEAVTEMPVFDVPDEAKPFPKSDNQVGEHNLQQRANGGGGDLEKNVFKIVEDSLKVVPQEQNLLQKQETPTQPQFSDSFARDLEANAEKTVEDSLKVVPEEPNLLQNQNTEIPENQQNLLGSSDSANKDLENSIVNVVDDSLKLIPDEPKQEEPQEPGSNTPPKDLEKNILEVVEDSLKAAPNEENFVGEEAPNDAPLQEEKLDSNNIRESAPSQVENRGQFDSMSSEESYFGAFVPNKNAQPSIDPRMKNLVYVGDNIHLPLKMFQDENGVMKLRVDTDALCNCRNKNCTKKHVDDRMRENEDDGNNTVLPELQVRFGRESHNEEDLMNSFVDVLHQHDENSEIFKRSPRIESGIDNDVRTGDKLQSENNIEKLNKKIEKYKHANEDLMNKGTIALYKDVEKSKNVDRMVTLASNLLSWMKVVAEERLNS